MTNVMDAPAPAPETVAAARRHLTERYAAGVDRLLWETGQRPMPDLTAIAEVLAANGQGKATGPVEIGCALVLVQAIRLSLDHLEHDLFEAASGAGITAKAVAAVLDLTDGAAAEARHRWLAKRRALPQVAAG